MRREVRDLKNNHPDQWNLYLMGLESLQWMDQSDPHSFYGLASKRRRHDMLGMEANLIHRYPWQTLQDLGRCARPSRQDWHHWLLSA